ncbi:MAG TPA: hypothetical protein DDW76_23860 [Cyanobacteria bacterium UBA11369]|nr:hypothetical protein [Cyanobacteria bacterium UBA11371]HBE51726.1 hypothetical protein [Cyanobacteria bacterium UBA11369]
MLTQKVKFMSLAPKFTVVGKTAPSKRGMVSLIQLPEVPLAEPDSGSKEPAQPIASSGTPVQQLRPRAPQERGVKTTLRRQKKQANREEKRERFSYPFGKDPAKMDAQPKAQATQTRLSFPDSGRSHQTLRQTAKLVTQSESMPVWLTWLMRWQRRSSVVTFLLVSATLAVYGGTVYTQQLWNREYRQLESLQLQQRQLTAASAVLKNKLAQQAEQQDTGLIPATPNTNLFLPPAQEQPKSTPSSIPRIDRAAKQQLAPTPVGY